MFFDLGNGDLKVLERQLPVVFAQLLGLLAVDCMVQLGHQMLEAFDDVLKFRSPHGGGLQGLEGHAVFRWQNGQIEVFGSSGHDRSHTPESWRGPLYSTP